MKNSEIITAITRAKSASRELLELSGARRKKVLMTLASEIKKNTGNILTGNRKDIAAARREGYPENFIERLTLNPETISGISEGLLIIANDEDILFKTISEKKRPSGIEIRKTVSPLGLIAIIYESRPNVTLDAFALAFKAGNAVILKGGREIKNTNAVTVGIIKKILKDNKISQDTVIDLCEIETKQTIEILSNRRIDCLIPRGGKGLIKYVSENAQIPVIITGASVVHTYVDKSADLNLAAKVVANAKGRRVSICNALDTLLLHKDIAEKFFSKAMPLLAEKNIELRADACAFEILRKMKYPKLKKAGKTDFDTEFLDYILAVRTVDDFSQALEHIQAHSLGHSEAIITRDKKQVEEFFRKIDAACLYHNTSTQFSDGGEFGMGGEIGISTQKLHARGPFSYRELTTHKYLVKSQGATRK